MNWPYVVFNIALLICASLMACYVSPWYILMLMFLHGNWDKQP